MKTNGRLHKVLLSVFSNMLNSVSVLPELPNLVQKHQWYNKETPEIYPADLRTRVAR
jgi:hypothetical protein